jgi:hypothetical protein
VAVQSSRVQEFNGNFHVSTILEMSKGPGKTNGKRRLVVKTSLQEISDAALTYELARVRSFQPVTVVTQWAVQ